MKPNIAKARLKHVRISPRKARLVIDLIRGKNVIQVLAILENTRRRSVPIIQNLLKSAIANAIEQHPNINPDLLTVTEARVDQGAALKRITARAMGRGCPILKRSSHITIAVG